MGLILFLHFRCYIPLLYCEQLWQMGTFTTLKCNILKVTCMVLSCGNSMCGQGKYTLKTKCYILLHLLYVINHLISSKDIWWYFLLKTSEIRTMTEWIWHIQHYTVLLINRYCKYEIKACSKRSILQHTIIQMPPLWDLICKSHRLLKQES